MASRKHEELANKLLDHYRQRPDTVAIMLFGSLAKGAAGPESDIDLEIISTAAMTWELAKQRIDGIAVDLVFVPIDHFRDQISSFPYLCYDYPSMKVLYDPKGIAGQAQRSLRAYFDAHPEVAAYWEENLKAMQEKKRAGTHRMADIVAAYDTAELLFSPDGKIRRTFLRGWAPQGIVRSRPRGMRFSGS